MSDNFPSFPPVAFEPEQEKKHEELCLTQNIYEKIDPLLLHPSSILKQRNCNANKVLIAGNLALSIWKMILTLNDLWTFRYTRARQAPNGKSHSLRLNAAKTNRVQINSMSTIYTSFVVCRVGSVILASHKMSIVSLVDSFPPSFVRLLNPFCTSSTACWVHDDCDSFMRSVYFSIV